MVDALESEDRSGAMGAVLLELLLRSVHLNVAVDDALEKALTAE